METVLRSLVVYFFLLVVFRLAGKRTLAQITAFDFVLLLIIGETTQQALLGDDFSIVNAVVATATLVGLDVAMSVAKHRSRKIDRIVEGLPVVLVRDGQLVQEHLDQSRIDLEDILSAARERQGLERMEQIRYAILERSGAISIIPREDAATG